MNIALCGATTYTDPSAEPIRDGVVIIEDGKISAVGSRDVRVPDDAKSIDCSGLTLTAGFWNSHVHFFERKWADAAAVPTREVAQQIEATLARFGFNQRFCRQLRVSFRLARCFPTRYSAPWASCAFPLRRFLMHRRRATRHEHFLMTLSVALEVLSASRPVVRAGANRRDSRRSVARVSLRSTRE